MALREILAKFGFEIDSHKLDEGKKGLEGYATSVKNLANKLAGGDIGQAVKDMVDDLKEQASTFRATSNQLGINAQELQKWQTGAKMAGVESNQLNAAFRLLQKNAAGAAHDANDATQAMVDNGDGSLEAALSGKAAAETFKALGVEVKDAQGNMVDTVHLMGEVGLKLAAIKSPAERTAMAMKMFGRQGTALIPMFAKGEEGLNAYLSTLEEMGGGISNETLGAMSDLSKATKRYDVAILSLKSQIGSALVPALTKKMQALGKAAGAFVNLTKNTNVVKAAFLVLGAAMLYLQRAAIMSALKMAIAYAPLILGLTAVVLLVDDLITAFQGGDSVIGKVLGKFVDLKDEHSIFGAMAKDVRDLNAQLDKTPGVADKIGTVVDTVATSLGRFIVEDVPDFFHFLWRDIGDGIATFLYGSADGTFSTWWEGFKGRVAEAFGGMGATVRDLGLSLMQGLADSITAGIQNVTGALSSLGTAFVQKLRDLFDWHSPPGLTVGLGHDLDAGLVKGLAEGAPAVQQGARATFSAVAGEAVAPAVVRSPMGGQGGGGGSRTMHVTNNVRNEIHAQGNGAAGVRDAVREGTGLGLSDLNADLAALEAQSATG